MVGSDLFVIRIKIFDDGRMELSGENFKFILLSVSCNNTLRP